MAYFGVNEHGRFDRNLAKEQFQSHVDNIVKKHAEATEALRKGGSEWYEKAHEEAKRVGGGDITKGAGIIAALSPLTDWNKNVAYAHQLVKTGDSPSSLIKKNVEKAQRIQAGEHPRDVLGGHKVRSFFENIHDPSSPEHVTIDRHAYDIAVGRPFVGTGGSRDLNWTPGKMSEDLGLSAKSRYDHFVDAYKSASQKLDIDVPNKAQAITWVAHRGAV